MIRTDGQRLLVATRTLEATFDRGWLTSLRSRAGEEFVAATGDGSPLQLVYVNQGAVDVLAALTGEVTILRQSDHAAQIRLNGWDADGLITVREDPVTGEVLVEPSAYSSRAGVQAVRWRLPGLRPDLELIAPLFQGVRLPLDDPLLAGRAEWPHRWEAGLAILQGAAGGFWIHCRDRDFRYKALDIRDGRLGFETEAYGPLEQSLGAGGLTWRINVHDGEWTGPAGAYRDWAAEAYGWNDAPRRPWCGDIRFAVSWYGGDLDLLDALAEQLDPACVLLHFSQWRSDAYDQNYPTYAASDGARAALAKARAMGFRVMPHCNSVDMDPTHPVYATLRDFQYRDLAGRRLLGWGYDHAAHQVIGVPNSNLALSRNRARNVMVKIHPGLSMWRSILCEEIARGLRGLDTDAVFIDVTLCGFNLSNCLVENTTTSEGMARLCDEVAALGEGLAVGGEGLNETVVRGLSFAQAHLYRSWQASVDGLERVGRCALGAFLFGPWCRTFGYSRLSGANDDETLRMSIHEQLGAIPTVTVRGAEAIRRPNAAVARQLELARG